MKNKYIISIIAIIMVSIFAWGLSDSFGLSSKKVTVVNRKHPHIVHKSLSHKRDNSKNLKWVKILLKKKKEIDIWNWTYAYNRPKPVVIQKVVSSSPPITSGGVKVVSGGNCTSSDYSGCIPASNPCAIPDYICRRESGPLMYINIRYTGAVSSNAGGKYQFLGSTFDTGLRMIGRSDLQGIGACNAPEYIQDQVATAIWNSPGGPGNWGA